MAALLSVFAMPALLVVAWLPLVAGLLGSVGLLLLVGTLVAFRGRVVLAPHGRSDRRMAFGPAMLTLVVACGGFVVKEMSSAIWTSAVTPLTLVAALAGAAVLFLLVMLDRKSMEDDFARLAAAAGGFVWAAAVLLQVNALLPQRLRVLTPVQVVDMADWSSRSGHHYQLDIGRADWTDVGVVSVSAWLYERVQPGDCVLMVNDRGVLGLWRRHFALCTPEAEVRLPRLQAAAAAPVIAPDGSSPSPRTPGSP